MINKNLDYSKIKDIKNENKQWNYLCSLFPIQEMRIRKIKEHKTINGTYNEYKVNLKINNMNFETRFHDSIYNYYNNKRPEKIEILACIVSDKRCMDGSPDFLDFCEMYPYGIKELRTAIRVYEGCKATQQYLNKALKPDDLEILENLLDNWGY